MNTHINLIEFINIFINYIFLYFYKNFINKYFYYHYVNSQKCDIKNII